LKFTSRRPLRARLYKKLVKTQRRLTRNRAQHSPVLYTYPPQQSEHEERINGWTHGAMAAASLIAGAWLVVAAARQGEPLTILGCLAYAVTLTSVFTMSALSHLVRPPRIRQLFRTLDQASIYLYTAGSFTPYFVRYLIPEGWEWTIPVMWGIALLGAWDKIRGDRVNSISLWLYMLLGWFPVLAAKPLLSSLPIGCTILIVTAGACYMLGLVFLLRDEKRQYFHAVWHLLVMTAGVLTYAGIAVYVLEPPVEPVITRQSNAAPHGEQARSSEEAGPLQLVGQPPGEEGDPVLVPAHFESGNTEP
jgi:hemolysin III